MKTLARIGEGQDLFGYDFIDFRIAEGNHYRYLRLFINPEPVDVKLDIPPDEWHDWLSELKGDFFRALEIPREFMD